MFLKHIEHRWRDKINLEEYSTLDTILNLKKSALDWNFLLYNVIKVPVVLNFVYALKTCFSCSLKQVIPCPAATWVKGLVPAATSTTARCSPLLTWRSSGASPPTRNSGGSAITVGMTFQQVNLETQLSGNGRCFVNLAGPPLCICCVAHPAVRDVSLYERFRGKSGSMHLTDLILWIRYLIDSLNETVTVFSG